MYWSRARSNVSTTSTRGIVVQSRISTLASGEAVVVPGDVNVTVSEPETEPGVATIDGVPVVSVVGVPPR